MNRDSTNTQIIAVHSRIGAGYWISPQGEVIAVTTHIAEICRHPELFGFSESELRDSFASFNEVWTSEGNARHEIILMAIQRGWIRLRHYRRRGWTANIPELSPRYLGQLQHFFVAAGFQRLDGRILIDFPDGQLRGMVESMLQNLPSTGQDRNAILPIPEIERPGVIQLKLVFD